MNAQDLLVGCKHPQRDFARQQGKGH